MKVHAQRSIPGRALGVLVGIVALAAACGGDDGASSDDEDSQANEAEAAAAGDGRCDAGFNTAAFYESAEPHAPHAHDDTEEDKASFTLEEWAEVFVQPDHPLSDGTPREDMVAYFKSNQEDADAILSGGLGHDLGPDSWEPMEDPAECQQLADELTVTREIVAEYPTLQDALDDGYVRIAQYAPGIASHYINFELFDEEFELDKPEMLLYDGDHPDANIAGVSHLVGSEEQPEAGFSSPNQHWHRHLGLCVKDSQVIGTNNLSEEECQAQGGAKLGGGTSWMNHVWVVPGCESDWGVFSGTNPALPLRARPAEDATEPGCGSGRAPDSELDFGDASDGPRL